MTTMSIGEARTRFAEAVNRVSYGGERILFARHGKPVAALVSAEDLEMLQRIEDAEDVRDALKVIREYERHPGTAVTLADLRKQRAAHR